MKAMAIFIPILSVLDHLAANNLGTHETKNIYSLYDEIYVTSGNGNGVIPSALWSKKLFTDHCSFAHVLWCTMPSMYHL